jgi:glycosyltransferase involved in cell wall biosynthesis
LLYCGPAGLHRKPGSNDPASSHWPCVSTLDSFEVPCAFRIENIWGACPSDFSDRVRHAVQCLHEVHQFDIIEFPAFQGLGFRSIQAKQALLGFGDALLAVRLNAFSQWRRAQNRRWPTELFELEIDFCERYAFERADAQIVPFPDMLQLALLQGWAARSENVVISGEREDGDALASGYHNLVQESKGKKSAGNYLGIEAPLVSVAVAHYNLGRYLPETLAALAEQTYANLEVLVIDDGSTDAQSIAVFETMQNRHPLFRFLRQQNAGIGATRNRGLFEARGAYFIPVDADNVPRPDMVERFVAAIQQDSDIHAMTCYFLAFRESSDLRRQDYVYAYRPTGGPHVLASIRNVYGDANAIFNTAVFQSIGGYETDRDTSFEDWEAFVNLVNNGYRVDVIPEHLFYYRHREAGFSRVTNNYRNHQRVLRHFYQLESLPLAERSALWSAFLGFHQAHAQLAERQRGRRYRLADRLHEWLIHSKSVARAFKGLFLST